ncbi:MAG: ATP-binding protein [Candidatus Promineifilaceae bacterium]|nr:ATP-binding protein [Candidatus Promineifilaceae bacterium]
MDKLWVRLSLAFSSVIVVAILLMGLTGRVLESDTVAGRGQTLTETERRQYVREQLPDVLLGMTAVVGLVGIAAGVWISRTLTAPLSQLEEAARDIGRRDLSRRVDVQGSREIVALGRAFNQMAGELQRQESLRRNLVADVAHELRTPLSILQGNLRAILDDVYPLDKAEVARLYDQTRHLSRLVRDLHDLARAEAHELPLDVERLNVGELVRATGELFAPLAEEDDVTLTVEVPDRAPAVRADAARLSQALQNLLANALRHTPAGGDISLHVVTIGNEVHLTVEDTGAGIAPDHMPRVFERFYRTDRARSRDAGGAGLGLAIVRATAEAHGGRVEAKSEGAGRGSAFTIILPTAGRATAREPS